jgi:hypothetical protein
MRGRPDEEVLRELMADMDAMDREKLGKKRSPSITIAIGVPKGKEEGEMEEIEENPAPEKSPASDFMGVENAPVSTEPPAMEEENEEDDEEDLLIEEAKALGIEEPEYMDMRLLKKLVERKKAQG